MMHGTVLVIDPIATNRIGLRVKLAASHYHVVQASSIAEAIQVIGKTPPELILSAVNLPDGPPSRLLARLRRTKICGKVPIIALSCAQDPQERLAMLTLGFDDVLEKPVDDRLLLARARSLMRAYASAMEWKLRDGTSRALGFAEVNAQFAPARQVKLVAHDTERRDALAKDLIPQMHAQLHTCHPGHVVHGDEDDTAPDAFVLVVEPGREAEMLGLLATIRSHANTRHSAVLLVQTEDNPQLAAQLLDMGANDLMPENAETAELALRLDTLLARKKVADALRDTVRNGIEAAVIDPLTGLHNRRYAMPHLTRIAERANVTGKPFAVMIADMDHFKSVNDRFGHAAGDAVLIETAQRLKANVRGIDLVARIGGEEFLIVLPAIGLSNAKKAALRLCREVRNKPIAVPGSEAAVTATVSIGMIVYDPTMPPSSGLPLTAAALLDRADRALYDAKAEGRNRVMLSRPAA